MIAPYLTSLIPGDAVNSNDVGLTLNVRYEKVCQQYLVDRDDIEIKTGQELIYSLSNLYLAIGELFLDALVGDDILDFDEHSRVDQR